jgi:hypothetical protein
MEYPNRHKPPFCDDNPIDCHFEVGSHPAGETVRNDDTNINYLIFSRSGHAWITSTLSHDEIPCADEMIFVPRGSECSDIWRARYSEEMYLCSATALSALCCFVVTII